MLGLLISDKKFQLVMANAGDCISGSGNFDHFKASATTQGKNGLDPTGGHAISFQDRGIGRKGNSFCGHDKCSKTGNLGCSILFHCHLATGSNKQSS